MHAIVIVILIILAAVYMLLRKAVNKQTIIRFDSATSSYTEVYEAGKLVATFNNPINN